MYVEFPRYLHLAREKDLPERVQAECQCRAPGSNFFNCIVSSKLRGDRAAWTSSDSRAPVAQFHQAGGFRPGVGDHY
jgi:hypothetical protein